MQVAVELLSPYNISMITFESYIGLIALTRKCHLLSLSLKVIL